MKAPVYSSLVLVILASTIAEPAFSKQAAVEVVQKTEAIPKNFKTWSLFLVCNPTWLDTARKGDEPMDLYRLYQQFQDFGRTIGDDNVAVWFWKSRTFSVDTPSLVKNVDVERSVRFCKAWKIAPSASPAVVVTSTYPNEKNLDAGRPPDSAIYELGNMKAQDISGLLAKVADGLVLGTPAATAESPGATPQLWIRLLQATQGLLNRFGCAWTFHVDAGPVKADLKACPEP